MSGVSRSDRTAASAFRAVADVPPKNRTALLPLTLRLTPEERTRLEELAAGMTLGAYVRACVFADEAKLRKTRPTDIVEDKKAAAEALALLGQSRIASNLNQLAYHANIGGLIVGGTEKAEIAEAIGDPEPDIPAYQHAPILVGPVGHPILRLLDATAAGLIELEGYGGSLHCHSTTRYPTCASRPSAAAHTRQSLQYFWILVSVIGILGFEGVWCDEGSGF